MSTGRRKRKKALGICQGEYRLFEPRFQKRGKGGRRPSLSTVVKRKGAPFSISVGVRGEGRGSVGLCVEKNTRGGVGGKEKGKSVVVWWRKKRERSFILLFWGEKREVGVSLPFFPEGGGGLKVLAVKKGKKTSTSDLPLSWGRGRVFPSTERGKDLLPEEERRKEGREDSPLPGKEKEKGKGGKRPSPLANIFEKKKKDLLFPSDEKKRRRRDGTFARGGEKAAFTTSSTREGMG